MFFPKKRKIFHSVSDGKEKRTKKEILSFIGRVFLLNNYLSLHYLTCVINRYVTVTMRYITVTNRYYCA